jgi:hypothetical protein
MAVAIVQDWVEEETDRSTTNYDAISARIMAQDAPAGMLVHAAGFTGNGFRISKSGNHGPTSTGSWSRR